MKRFAVVAIAFGAVLALSACGNAEKEQQMQAQIDTCTKDKQASEAKVTELQAKVDDLQKQVDAAKATPTPSPEPAKGAKTEKGAKAPAKTPAKPAATKPAAAASPSKNPFHGGGGKIAPTH